MASDIKILRQRLRKQGFTLQTVPNGHTLVTAPDGRTCQIPRTPRCNGNGFKNMLVRLKRHVGYDPRAS